MRTTQEIIDYCKKESKDVVAAFTGFTLEVSLPYLSVEEVRPFLKDGADLSEWKQQPLTSEHILSEMREYMEFAWGKVEDHRGLSAIRSIEKMGAWLWLLGDEELRAFANMDENYAQYGAPILKKTCEKYGFPIPDDDGIRNMAQGRPCWNGCDQGCGM